MNIVLFKHWFHYISHQSIQSSESFNSSRLDRFWKVNETITKLAVLIVDTIIVAPLDYDKILCDIRNYQISRIKTVVNFLTMYIQIIPTKNEQCVLNHYKIKKIRIIILFYYNYIKFNYKSQRSRRKKSWG